MKIICLGSEVENFLKTVEFSDLSIRFHGCSWHEFNEMDFSDAAICLVNLNELESASSIDRLRKKLPGIHLAGYLSGVNLSKFRSFMLAGVTDIFVGESTRVEKNRQFAALIDHVGSGRKTEKLSVFEMLLGGDEGWKSQARKIFKAAVKSKEPVLIQGETGSGKDILARAIHASSELTEKKYVAFNCASVPEDLLSAELFGCVEGAYTGAVPRPGRAEYAEGGTLFLDELGEMPKDAQAKLLRLIENREFVPLGSNEVRKMDARILAAVNQPLSQLKAGVLRTDLYYRLNTLFIKIPPLRKRKSEIPGLIERFINEFDSIKKFSSTAVEIMLSYDWPGNIRQLRNVVRRSILLSENDVIMADEVEFF